MSIIPSKLSMKFIYLFLEQTPVGSPVQNCKAELVVADKRIIHSYVQFVGMASIPQLNGFAFFKCQGSSYSTESRV